MRGVPGFIGFVYGFVGLASLAYFVISAATLIFYLPSVGVERRGLLVLIYFTLPFLNAMVCFFLAYGFFTLRRWGGHAAIAYNACWLVLIGSGAVQSRSASWTPGTIVVTISVVGFLMGVILFCATKRGRELMSI